MTRFRSMFIALTLTSSLAAGCRLGTEPEPQVLDELVNVSGDEQIGPPNTALPNPLVVQMNDRQGRPVAGVRIAWAVEVGNGTVTPAVTLTNRDGRAQASWTLGAQGGHAVIAFVDEPGAFGMEVYFTANAVLP